MIELYVSIGVGTIVLAIWLRHKYVIKKNAKLEAENINLGQVVNHHEAIAQTKKVRKEGQKKRIQERVQKTIEDEFGEFYD